MLNKGRTNVLSRIKRRSTWRSPTTRCVPEFGCRDRLAFECHFRSRHATGHRPFFPTVLRDFSFIDGRNWHALIRIGRIMAQISYIYERRFARLIPSMRGAEWAGRRIGTCAVFKCYRITPRCGRFGHGNGQNVAHSGTREAWHTVIRMAA